MVVLEAAEAIRRPLPRFKLERRDYHADRGRRDVRGITKVARYRYLSNDLRQHDRGSWEGVKHQLAYCVGHIALHVWGVPTWASLIAQGSRRRLGAAVRHLSPCRLSGLVTVISHRQLAVSPPTDEKAIARDSSRREESTCRTAQGKDVHPVEGAACVNVCQQCPHRSCVREACARLPS